MAIETAKMVEMYKQTLNDLLEMAADGSPNAAMSKVLVDAGKCLQMLTALEGGSLTEEKNIDYAKLLEQFDAET